MKQAKLVTRRLKRFTAPPDKHVPIKLKTLRGNQAPFMTRDLRKAIYNRSRLKNNLNKNQTNENRIKYKKQRNKCVSLRKKAIKSHFESITRNGIMSSKNFWNTIKPFITNKSGLTNNDIMLIHNNTITIITDENILTGLFNDHYINIVEASSGIKLTCLSGIDHTCNNIISDIITKYKNHPSITKIRSNKTDNELFHFHEVQEKEIKSIFQGINPKKSTGEELIPPKLVKITSNALIKPVTDAINSSIRTSNFPRNAKRAAVVPLDKGGTDKS